MKISAHIYALESNGESIKITAQGTAAKSPGYMADMSHIEVLIPATKTNEKTFYLGRKIEVTIEPK